MGARIAGGEANGTVPAGWLMAWRAAVSRPWGAWGISHVLLQRRDDVADGAARLGRVALVVDERLVRRAGDGAVNAGARQPGEVVLFGSPGRRGARAGAQDGQGPVAEAGQLGGPVELGRHLVDILGELARLRRRLALLGIGEHPRETHARERGHDGQHPVGAGERVVLVGVHRVEQDDAADLGWVALRVGQREHAAEGMAGDDVRAGDLCAGEQDVQIAGRVRTADGAGSLRR
jgi:hypothetical protein